jgi:cytochrome c oxidase assembly factor CtaG
MNSGLWRLWTFDPGIVIPLALSAILFGTGARGSRGTSGARRLLFWSGWIVLTVALISPIHELGESLFSAHMVQHELLMLVAAPLLVLARPLVPMLWALPIGARKKIGAWSKRPSFAKGWSLITKPVVAWILQAAAIWVWHIPALFDMTLRNDWVHAAQHVSFLGTSMLFWWSMLYSWGPASYGRSFLAVFTTAIHTSLLGVLMTFAREPWYSAYAATTKAWGLTPLEDQQIGGLIMWIPAGIVYVGAGLALFAAWLRESDVVATGRAYAN